jgi:hypothetical protein
VVLDTRYEVVERVADLKPEKLKLLNNTLKAHWVRASVDKYFIFKKEVYPLFLKYDILISGKIWVKEFLFVDKLKTFTACSFLDMNENNYPWLIFFNNDLILKSQDIENCFSCSKLRNCSNTDHYVRSASKGWVDLYENAGELQWHSLINFWEE